MNAIATITTTLKDWESDQEVRWCPGCGDYAILKAVQRTMPEIGATPENTRYWSLGSSHSITLSAGSSKYSTPLPHTPTPVSSRA